MTESAAECADNQEPFILLIAEWEDPHGGLGLMNRKPKSPILLCPTPSAPIHLVLTRKARKPLSNPL